MTETVSQYWNPL